MNGEQAQPGPYKRLRDTLRFEPPARAGRLDGPPAASAAAAGATGVWVLESRLGGDGSLSRTSIHQLPFRMGRAAGVSMHLQSGLVSKLHAEIYSDGLALRVRDLGSRNGTFVNHAEIDDAPLHEGDVLHVGDYEFRVARDVPEPEADDAIDGTRIRRSPLSRHFAVGASRAVREMLDTGAVTMLFQPIVLAPGSSVSAYEALGRGRHPELPESPVELFDIAGTLGPDAQCALSRLFRRKAVELVRDREVPPQLFLNTHPVELERPGLLDSLAELRLLAPNVGLVLEIHESALAQTNFIAWLRERLAEMNVGIAYDDFGAGQARLFELAEAPPHYLKFDRRFVTGLDHAPLSRQRLVASLVAAARELLVRTVAEGIETAAEAQACLRAGFSHAQGYHFGRPAAVERLA
jgi:EAL domain-containing protein (putative c-di-GMP-specific phosphodiesterase class I)